MPFSGTNLLKVTLPTVDQDDSITVTLHVAHGTLALAAGTDTSGSPVLGIGTQTLTFTGLQSAVDTVLAGLQYTPTAEFEGKDTLTFTALVTDTASGLPTSTATASTSVTINVNPVAETPVLTAPTTVTTAESETGEATRCRSAGRTCLR